MIPVKIQVEEEKYLTLVWSSGEILKIKLANLRLYCPCAICKAQRDEWSDSYIPLYSDDQLGIKQIKLVGGYALNPVWKDGHDTGIYEYNYLREIG